MSACGVRPSVCLSCSWVASIRIFKISSPSGSHTILVFSYQTGWRYSDGNPLTGTSNAGGVAKKRDSGRICICVSVCVYWCLQHLPRNADYGRPLSVSGRPCHILPMFFFIFIFFYGRLILWPWWTEVRESFTRGGPWVSLKKLLLGFFSGHP